MAGWHNPKITWSELERRLSGRPDAGAQVAATPPAEKVSPRQGSAHTPERDDSHIPYAELHAHSHYSFLDGASSPQQLIRTAAELDLDGIAITDHDGLYGAARFAEEATAFPNVRTVYGAELSLGLDVPQLGAIDPVGTHLLALAHGQEGYHRLASAITHAQLAGGAKGRPVYDLESLAESAGGEWAILTGCRKGAVQQALNTASNRSDGEDAALLELNRLIALFGRDQVHVELTHHGRPGDDARIDQLAGLAKHAGVPILATGNVHYATLAETPLAEAVAAVRARRSLAEMNPYLPANGSARLRSGAWMLNRFARHADAVLRTAPLARELAFPLAKAKPNLPRIPLPDGQTQMGWLRELVWRGAEQRYGQALDAAKRARIERELGVIEAKDFPGYFLIVHDIVQHARSLGILCQGRGSAANSAVCYVLEITAVDSIYYDLPFERFLSSMRDEEPDIDVDFDSERREEVIQYVYAKYGRLNAAQVANVITYRPKAAVRDAARALGYSSAQQTAWTKQLERGGKIAENTALPAPVAKLAEMMLTAPRHLGIHSGGMVLTDRPVGEVCPIEHARMERRTVLQWDKDDCASMGLVKFDLLGLGMLSAIRKSFDMIAAGTGEQWSIETIPREESGVYDMLCRGDAVGVFQLESRAQLNTLPRLKPRKFTDLVIEIALIRPGPVQGGSVHPYLRRRSGAEPITYPHPTLEPVLKRTLGIPLFQEQLMQMAMAVGNFTGEDADQLRRAMGSKRGEERIDKLKSKLFTGMAEHGIVGDEAARIFEQIEAFASFGFAESHSISFALLVYVSAWLKLHYPAAFLAGLLQSQPMGFYSPRSLVEDSRRHGVEVLPPDVQFSDVASVIAPSASQGSRASQGSPSPLQEPSGIHACTIFEQPPVGLFDSSRPDESGQHRRDRNVHVRLGLTEIRGIETATAERIVAARAREPFLDMADLARRADLSKDQLEALASAGACSGIGLERREALWSAGPSSENRERYLPGIATSVQPPLLPLLTPGEQSALDLWSTGVVTEHHPLSLLRDQLDVRRVVRSDRTSQVRPGSIVEVAGVVTHRQRPSTAGGVTFLTLEDESGTVNIVVWQKMWERHRLVARSAPALIVRGRLERSPEGVENVVAESFEPLAAPPAVQSRDFQ
ncbi:error-prone DNA polymerase [Leucobacter sp. cx-328]|uniref:error-prone DNA polymerase n=1 Tax=unclassified Leucobacter TaxID=2621730 RepID=UPI00165E82C4|nr:MULTISPECIES: error-prone DNA polymerase [unclassified Leucobacter]MBC9944466.1 error-prone DNA polymerase [Leucobacter sp. cx-328]